MGLRVDWGPKNKSFLLPRSSYSCTTEIPALWKSYQTHSCRWVISSSRALPRCLVFEALRRVSWADTIYYVRRFQGRIYVSDAGRETGSDTG